ncbi:MAG: HlyD family secretion protein [Candidatus Eremiobacteraeota bacterium]|nr:HlyD family secretion protein [Candidatus Eremiobacteraeota bacterium]
MDTREADQERTRVAARGVANGTGKVSPEADDANSGDAERSGPRKRVFFIAGGALVLILALVFGIPWLTYTLGHEGTDDARVDADVVAVTSKISERIDRILVETNQPVHKGQLLMILDNKDELYRLQQAQAQYDLALANQRTTTLQNQGGVTQAAGNAGTAEAQVPVAQAGVDQAAAQLSVARAQIPAAQQAYAKAQADYNRTNSLVASGDVAASQLDTARAALAAAAAQWRGAQDQTSAAQAAVEEAQSRVAASSASAAAAQGGVTTAQGKLEQASDPSQVESAKAQLALAKQNLAYTRIYSPIDGFVGEKDAEQGQTIGAGTTLMTLVPQKIFVTANYKETQMGKMRVGQPADIKVDAYKGVTFHGHLESINPASQNTYALVPAQNATGNFVKVTQRIPVRISIDDPRSDMPLRPGMSVETYVSTK